MSYSMTPELKAELDRIVTFLNTDREGTNLWYILSALRGPDYANSGTVADYDRAQAEKEASTAVLRQHIGLTCIGGILVNPDSKQRVDVRCNMTGWSHFKSHVQEAFSILGLDWHSSNDPEPEPGNAEPGIHVRKVFAEAAIT